MNQRTCLTCWNYRYDLIYGPTCGIGGLKEQEWWAGIEVGEVLRITAEACPSWNGNGKDYFEDDVTEQ